MWQRVGFYLLLSKINRLDKEYSSLAQWTWSSSYTNILRLDTGLSNYIFLQPVQRTLVMTCVKIINLLSSFSSGVGSLLSISTGNRLFITLLGILSSSRSFPQHTRAINTKTMKPAVMYSHIFETRAVENFRKQNQIEKQIHKGSIFMNTLLSKYWILFYASSYKLQASLEFSDYFHAIICFGTVVTKPNTWYGTDWWMIHNHTYKIFAAAQLKCTKQVAKSTLACSLWDKASRTV